MPEQDCPNCGATVPTGAEACPECGSDESTGWSQSAYCESLGIPDPDEEFDHDAFVENEFGRPKKKPTMSPLIWTMVAIVVILVLLGIIR
jgi:RNA polymerase subunit RPABC4/transcription elongation factor Spt4